MSGLGGDLDPLIQKWAIIADEESFRRTLAWVKAQAAKQARAFYDSAEKESKKGQSREEAEFKAHLRAMERENATHNAKVREQNKAASAKEVEQKKILGRQQVQADEHAYKQQRNIDREHHEKRLESHKILGRKQVEQIREDAKRRLEAEAQGNRHRLENHRQADRKELALVQGQVKKVLEAQAQGNRHKLENHRQAGRLALQAQRQADARVIQAQDQANRLALQARRSADASRLSAQNAAQKRQQATLEAGFKRQLSAQEAAQQKSIDRHKAMWSTVRTLTETGSRFMSSITQSALRSMGSAVGIGLSRITGVYKREGGQQEAALRSTYADQEAITRRALVRQQGIIQGFQARNSAVTQGGAGGGPIGAIMSVRNMLLGAGAFISARAIFGPVIDYQQTQIAFEGILQSSTAAEAMLAELQEFAKVTPFTFTGIADSAKQLLAVGYAADDVIPMMTTLGNTAAGLGLGEDAISGVIRALGQMKGKGKASAEELQQISEQLPGFSAIEAIAGSMGITVAEAFDEMKAGAIPADAAITAILEGMERMPGAAGAMERQSKTLAGRLSTLKDTIEILLIKAMDPFIESISKAVGMFTTFLDNLFNASGIFAVARSAILGLAIAFGSMLAYQGVLLMLDGIRLALVGITQAPWLVMFTGLVVAMTMLYRHVPGVAEAFHSLWDALSGIASGALETVRETFADLGENLLPNIAVMLRWIAKGEWVKALESLRGILREAMEGVWDALLSVADFLRPFAGLLVSAFEYAFWSVQVWLNSGGVGRLWDALGGALESAMGRFKNFDWGSLVQPALIGLAGAVAFAFGGLPLLIGTALIALSPRLRGGITEVLSGAVGAVGAALPRLLFNALHDAAEFLSGPLLATIFGPVGVRIIAGIAGAIIAGGVAIGTGLIDGLKRSLPSVIDAVQGLVNDIISAVTDAMDSIPILGVLLREAFMPFEVVLRGIIPTLGVFVDLIKLIPTPILLAATAVYGLVKAWALLKVTTRAGSALTAITGMLDTMALRTMYAGDAVRNLGTRLTAATAPAITAGAASRMQIAMGTIGIAARKAGTAISNVGAAMPGIAMAAVIGLPIILGAWEKQKAAAKAHRAEVEANAASVFDLTSTFSDLAEETIKSNSAIRDGLNEAGVSVQEFTSALAESQESAQSMIATLSEGISTSDLINGDTALEFAFQMGEAADSALAMAEANDQLTQSEINRIAAVRAGEATTDTLIGIQVDVANRLNGVAEANDRQAESYRELRDRIDEVANSTSLFSDVMDRLTNNALPLTRVRQNIEDAIAAFRELMNDPDASPGEQERAFTDYAEAIRTAANDLVALDRPLGEVTTAYELQRDALLEQLTAFLGSSDAAEDYAETVLGIPPLSETVAEFVVAEANRRVERLEGRLEELGAMSPSPSVDLRTANAQEKLDELKNYLDIVASAPWVAEFHVRVTSDFEEWLQTPAGSGVTPEDMLQLARGYAKGGLVTRPELALIGEAGPELILPLSDPRRMAELLSQHAGAVAGAMPATSASLPGAAISMGAPTVNAEGIAAWIEATAAALAPLGERIAAATTPGMRMWANAVERVLGRILSGFETWGDRMVSLAVSISAAITAGITDGLREGRSEVVRITRGYARSLVGALNPLLTGIGETPIELNFAKGGIAEAHHGAQVHVFNEGRRGRGSSHGEAYIPFDPSNRARSRELAAETARRLGGNVQWFADGGITTPTIQSGQLVPGVTGDVVGLVAEFARRLSTWSLANGGGYHVGSGYRSIEEQTRLYQRYLAGVPGQAPAAPPGRSMHNFGLASDGNHWRNLRPEEFGLRFPMSYEPWHVEPAEGRALLGDTDFPSFQPLPRPPEAGQRGWLSQVAAKLMAYVYDKTLAYAGGLSYSGTAPTLGSASASPAILAAIRQAMGIVGVPASWLGPLLTLISRESSFNPNAYNSILGASGLTQTIPSTFAAYALPGYGGIFNPVANVIAGLRYILARYGTIFNVGQAVSPTPTKGYSYGGIVERDGLYRLAEGNRREAILPLDNPGRTNEILRRLGLLPDDGDQRVTVDSLRQDSAASRNAATLAPVVGEMNVYSNAMDPEIVATLAAAKVNRVAARVRG